MAHEFYQGVYAKTPAWHRLGTVWPDLLTTDEAIRESGIDFGVEKVKLGFVHPVTGGWVEIDDNVGVFGGDALGDHGIVGIHSPEYETDGFGDHARSVGFGPDERVWECMVLLRRGRIFTGTVRLPDLDRILPDGSNYVSCVVPYSSHDGTYAITIKDSAYRRECANQLRALDGASAGRVFRILHRSGKDEQRQKAAQVMVYAQERADHHAAQCEALLKQQISDRQLDELLQTIWPVPDEKGRSRSIALNKHDDVRAIYRNAPDLQGLQGTAWGVLQAFGEYTDHAATYRGTDPNDRERSRNENRLIRTIIKRDTVADKALELVAAA